MFVERAETISNVAANLIEEPKANGISILFVLGIGSAGLCTRPVPRLVLRHTPTDQVFCPGFNMKLKFGLYLLPDAFPVSNGIPPYTDSSKSTHTSPGVTFRSFATRLAMSFQRSLSVLSWRLPAAV